MDVLYCRTKLAQKEGGRKDGEGEGEKGEEEEQEEGEEKDKRSKLGCVADSLLAEVGAEISGTIWKVEIYVIPEPFKSALRQKTHQELLA